MKNRVLSLLIVALLIFGLLVGCTDSDTKVSVESVGLITGTGSTTGVNRFAGEVVSSKTIKIEKDSELTIDEIFVKQGDEVAVGDVLFAYDVEAVQLAVDKLSLEIQQLETSIKQLKKNVAAAQKRLDNANAANELERKVALQTYEIQLKEAQYNLSLKTTDKEKKERTLQNAEVVSEIDGSVQSVNEESTNAPFITLMETSSFRVKGTINELNQGVFVDGSSVLIRSRLDHNKVWTGSIAKIDWDNPVSNTNYYGNDTGSSATKYTFYVDLDDASGLILGQHVYIEPFNGVLAGDGLWLPSYYINDAENGAWVWAASNRDKLEKRDVTLGEYNADADCWEVLDGLTSDDFIAFPAENLEAGQPVSYYDESSFSSGEGGEGGFTAEEGGEGYEDLPATDDSEVILG